LKLSEENKSTGVVFSWEQQAIRGEEIPTGLEYPDQVLFLSLRMLYAQKRAGAIDRETAISEKKKLLDQYRIYKFRDDMEKQWVRMVKDTEILRAEYRKNPTVDNGMKLIAAIEGGKYCEISESV
jgi:hypothetical protein